MITENKSLVEKRQGLIEQMKSLVDEQRTTLEAGKDFPQDKLDQIERIEKDIDIFDDAIERIERMAVRPKEEITLHLPNKIEVPEKDAYLRTFAKYFWRGKDELTPEERMTLKEGESSLEKGQPGFQRAQTTQTGSSGGFLIPTLLQTAITAALRAAGGMRSVADIWTTPNGDPFNWPTYDDTGNNGRWLGENAQITETDLTFAQIAYEAWTAVSDSINVPIQLIQDEVVGLERVITEAFANRMGRLLNIAYTTGDGSAKPHGCTVDAHASKTCASPTAVTGNEIIDLQETLDEAYQLNAKFMFHQSTRKAVRKLTNTDGEYIWQPGLRAGSTDLLLGKEYVINNNMAEMGASNKFMMYGDFSHYKIRDVMGFTIFRLNERYMDYLQVGFLAALRTDGRLLRANATTYNPMKIMTSAAS